MCVCVCVGGMEACSHVFSDVCILNHITMSRKSLRIKTWKWPCILITQTIYHHNFLLTTVAIKDRGEHCGEGWRRGLNEDELADTEGADRHHFCLCLKICEEKCHCDLTWQLFILVTLGSILALQEILNPHIYLRPAEQRSAAANNVISEWDVERCCGPSAAYKHALTAFTVYRSYNNVLLNSMAIDLMSLQAWTRGGTYPGIQF